MRGSVLRVLVAVAASLTVAGMAAGWMFSAPDSKEVQGETPAEGMDASAVENSRDHEAGDEDHTHEQHAHGPANAANDNASAPLEGHQPRHDHALADRPGQRPSRAEASEFDLQFERFIVRGNEGLEQMADDGYITGSGTLEDPYVISEFRVTDELSITDTSRPLVIENSYIDGQLRLNYVGEEVYVHDNHVHDLRVNENVERRGPTTAGLFEDNELEFIGQLRHFGGTFRHNDVGPRPDNVVETYLSDTGPADLPDNVVWNFDGYHLGHVHNNTVEGRVDIKLHGHFHGSCLACPAHAHQDPDGFPPEQANQGDQAGEDNGTDEANQTGGQAGQARDRSPKSSHSYRYHTLDFENNTIQAGQAQLALRVLDQAHAGDDRTAASEPNEYLEDRHEHHQYVRLHANELRQGKLLFDVVNAEDARHGGLVQQATLDLSHNEVVLDRPRGTSGLLAAYEVQAGDNAWLRAQANLFAFQEEDSAAPEGYRWAVDGEPADTTGLLLRDVDASHVEVNRTVGENATYGVTLADVDDTRLLLFDNRFDASQEDRHDA